MIKLVKEALVTDYLSSDDLHKIMRNPEFGSFSSYQQIDGMIVRTDNHNVIKSRYWKFIKNSDGNWEVYEVDNDGRKIGSPFLAESIEDYKNDSKVILEADEGTIDDFIDILDSRIGRPGIKIERISDSEISYVDSNNMFGGIFDINDPKNSYIEITEFGGDDFESAAEYVDSLYNSAKEIRSDYKEFIDLVSDFDFE